MGKLLIGMSYLSKSCWAGLILTLLFFAADKIVRKKSRRGEDYILVFIMFVYLITLLMITVLHKYHFSMHPPQLIFNKSS